MITTHGWSGEYEYENDVWLGDDGIEPKEHTMESLRELQALPLDDKIALSRARIAEWYKFWDGDVCISFSGGKDSTVLRDLVHSMYPEVPCVWVNTGLEYPEIQQFVRSDPDSVIVRPAMDFKAVITEYGYPIISKEVSEAIYYARRKHPRISSGGGGGTNSEPERVAQSTGRSGWNSKGKETIRRQREFLGKRMYSEKKHQKTITPRNTWHR